MLYSQKQLNGNKNIFKYRNPCFKMLERKVQSKKRYLLAFLIGTLLFIIVVLISYSIAYFQYAKISDIQGETAYSIFEDKLAYSFFGEDICSIYNFRKVSDSLSYQGQILEDLEKKFGKDDKNVLERKKFYSVLLLEHLIYVKEYNKQCNQKINTIMFFYSNKDNPDASESAGKVLNSVYQTNQNLVIYSFDFNLESQSVDNLKKKYSVSKIPEIIINENQTLFWPFSSSEIKSYLK